MIKFTKTDSERKTMLIGEEIRNLITKASHVFPYCSPDMQSRQDCISERNHLLHSSWPDHTQGAQKGGEGMGTGCNNHPGPWLPYTGQYGPWIPYTDLETWLHRNAPEFRRRVFLSYQHCWFFFLLTSVRSLPLKSQQNSKWFWYTGCIWKYLY